MDRDRLYRCVGLVIILVIFFLGLYSGYRHATEPGEPVMGMIVGLASAVFATLLLALGTYVYFRYPDDGQVIRISLWSLGTGVFVGAIMLIFLLYFMYEGDVDAGEINNVALHTVTVGGLVGAIIGYYDTLHLEEKGELAEKNEELEESRRKLEVIGETSPDEVFITDEEGRLIFASKAKQRILGYDPEEALGRSFRDFLKRPGDPTILEIFEKVKGGERFLNLEIDALNKDGEPVPVEVSLAPMLEEGKFAGLVGVLRDVTEREEAERRLAKINRAYRVLSDAESAVVWADDEEAMVSEICRIIVEEGGYRMAWVGLAQGDGDEREVVPVAAYGYLDGYLNEVEISWNPDEPEGEGPTGKAIREGEPEVVQNMMVEPDYGPWREAARQRGYSSSIALPMELEDGTRGALNVYSSEPEAFDEEEADLLQQLSEDLAYGIDSLRNRRERLERERIMQVMDRVFRHNLRNRINLVQGYLSDAADGVGDDARESMDKVEEEVGAILSHSEKAHRINQVVLEDYEPVEQDIGEVVEGVVETLRPHFPEKELHLSVEGDVRAVAIQEIDTAVRELVENALEYAGDWTDIRVERMGGSVMVRVADRGPGIPEEEIKVLTREREIEPLYHGSGLGLWLAHWIVEKSGGEIEFEENEPSGSIVKVYLEQA